MQIDNCSCNIQPHTQARIGSTNIAAPKETLENAFLLAVGNTNTRIADCELRQGCSIISVCPSQLHTDHPTFEREFERIADNRANHLGDAPLIETAWKRRITAIERDRVLLIGGLIFPNYLIDDSREISDVPINW